MAHAVVIETGGGLLLLLGFCVRFVAFVVALFTLATAVIFHRNFAEQNQMIHFLKNVMLAGGAAADRLIRRRRVQSRLAQGVTVQLPTGSAEKLLVVIIVALVLYGVTRMPYLPG